MPTPLDVLEDEQYAARDFWTELPGEPPLRVPRGPFSIDGHVPEPATAGPAGGSGRPEASGFRYDAATGEVRVQHANDGQSPALEGVRVLDVAGPAGALATRILADLGAEVVMVEPPEGTALRRAAPFLDDEPGLERGYRHLYFDAGKRSVIVDGETAAEAIAALARSARILVETPETGAARSESLADRLAAANADLIRVAITPFGPNAGERAHWRSSDLVAQATGGLLAVSGDPADPPTRGPAESGHTMSSLAAAAGALIALTAQERGNGGSVRHVEVSM